MAGATSPDRRLGSGVTASLVRWARDARRGLVDAVRTLRRRLGRDPSPVGATPWSGRRDVSSGTVARLGRRVGRIVAQRSRSVVVPAGSDLADPRLEALALAAVPIRSAGAPPPGVHPGPDASDHVIDRVELEKRAMAGRRRRRRLGRPSVSVLLATKRPWALETAIGMIAEQRDVDVEVIVGLHGEVWDGWEPSTAPEPGLDIRWRRIPAELTLGAMLADLSADASGDFVSKWDDDDWYGPDHLADVVDALLFSRATIAGKAAEFVYLEGADVTIRRSARGGHRFGRLLAGGTLTIARDDLVAVGGWSDLPRHVDVALLDSVERAGGTAYRTHGFDYLLHRRSGPDSGHTWSATDDYFLSTSSACWEGRRLDVVASLPDSVRPL